MKISFSLPDYFSIFSPAGNDPFADWHSLIVPVIEKLRGLATTSENEFLQIGEQMQGVYQNSFEISQIANQLVEAASGENLQVLSARLQQMASEMESFLARFQARSTQNFSTLNHVKELLDQLDGPLEGAPKMAQAFYMLEVSIKIESARLGKMGEGFVTLATDIKNLSQQVNDKMDAIKEHRGSVITLISKNISAVKQLGSVEEEDARLTLSSTLSSLHELDSAHERFTQLGGTIASIGTEISSCVGEVVSSLQFNDINRQQLEHIIEALERLTADISVAQSQGMDAASRHSLIVAAGDACELQEGQLHFASLELYTAVSTIIESLRDVASRQATIQHETTAVSGVMDESGTSFIDDISRGISTTTTLLNTCAGSHHEVSRTMEKMAASICASTVFVNEINVIGYSIVKTALNAQIKAGNAGQQGAGLAALAEEIKQLSNEASQNTDEIALKLGEINSVTTHLINESSTDETRLTAWLTTVEDEVHEIMAMLGDMKNQLYSLVTLIQDKIRSLAEEVEKITARIDVHDRSKSVADEVLIVLGMIVAQSREIVPASSDFKESLKKMNEQYTMESERRVHQAIASRYGVELELADQSQLPVSTGGESGFGDNVDLF